MTTMISRSCLLWTKTFPRITGTNATLRFVRQSSRFSTVAPPTTKVERPRRALMSVPGSSQKMIDKARALGADAVVLDLEDGVAYDKKEAARELVSQALASTDEASFGTSEVCVRINALETKKLALDDLLSILPCPQLQSIVIPKVETAADIHFVSRMIDAYGRQEDVRILAALESAKGFLNLKEIATADPRFLDALIFASEDYCADLQVKRTEQALELLVPRTQLVQTAKAYGLQAIDMVHIDFRNMEGLQEECQVGVELGFTGKQAIHPKQVDVIQSNFVPSAKDIDFATRVVTEYQATTAKGVGACVVDGIVVDAPVYKWAAKIVKRAEVAGLTKSTE